MRHNRKVKIKLKKAMELGYLSPPWPYTRNGPRYSENVQLVPHRTYMLTKKQQRFSLDDYARKGQKFVPWKGWKRFYYGSNRRFHVPCRVCSGYGYKYGRYYDENGVSDYGYHECTACGGKTHSPRAYHLP